MGQVIRVTDAGDPRLADYTALTDAELRKRYEHEHGVFIAEGPNVVQALLASRYRTRSLLLSDEHVDTFAPEVGGDVLVYAVDRALLYEVVRFRLHQGVLGCGERTAPRRPAEVVAPAGLVAVLEGLNDHENLGALFRSGRALGVDAVLLGPGCADPLYRRSVRVSMGHVLHLPHARVATIEEAADLLHDDGFTVLALTPGPDAIDLAEVALPAGARVAVLLGAEGPGLTRAALSAADAAVRIPIEREVDSLNVAAAGAIAFHVLGRR